MHWTYTHINNSEEDLQQGDIIIPNNVFYSELEKIHPYFCNKKYLGFIILTQSCDLVRRNEEQCSSDYICLGVIRDLESLLPRLFEKSCTKLSSNVYLADDKFKAIQLIKRILNQNEQSLGLFYLHEDNDSGIAESSVALLRVNFSLRAKDHYHKLVKLRSGRIAAPYKEKLGWLSGNLYSRIGTPDWSEKESRNKIENLIKKYIDNESLIWLSKEKKNLWKVKGFRYLN